MPVAAHVQRARASTQELPRRRTSICLPARVGIMKASSLLVALSLLCIGLVGCPPFPVVPDSPQWSGAVPPPAAATPTPRPAVEPAQVQMAQIDDGLVGLWRNGVIEGVLYAEFRYENGVRVGVDELLVSVAVVTPTTRYPSVRAPIDFSQYVPIVIERTLPQALQNRPDLMAADALTHLAGAANPPTTVSDLFLAHARASLTVYAQEPGNFQFRSEALASGQGSAVAVQNRRQTGVTAGVLFSVASQAQGFGACSLPSAGAGNGNQPANTFETCYLDEYFVGNTGLAGTFPIDFDVLEVQQTLNRTACTDSRGCNRAAEGIGVRPDFWAYSKVDIGVMDQNSPPTSWPAP